MVEVLLAKTNGDDTIIIAIGLILAPSAISNCQANWLLAFVALGTVIVCNIWGKGMVILALASLDRGR